MMLCLQGSRPASALLAPQLQIPPLGGTGIQAGWDPQGQPLLLDSTWIAGECICRAPAVQKG